MPAIKERNEVGASSLEIASLDKPDMLAEAARAITENVVSDAVRLALAEDGRSLRDIRSASGISPSLLSRLANGDNCEVETLARIALALGKTLNISFD